MTVSDLVAFLLARLAEDEQVARAATPGPWVTEETFPGASLVQSNLVDMAEWPAQQSANVASESSSGDLRTGDAMHIARHDPARVLAEVAAKRRIIDRQEQIIASLAGEPLLADGNFLTLRDAGAVLRLLALPYADHADYRDEW